MTRAGRTLLVLGSAGLGVAAGVAAERALMRVSFPTPADGDDAVGTLRGDPHPLTADDGTVLHVEIDEPADPAQGDVTVVFSHGYSLNLDTWHYQRQALRGRARLVLWDQRSHGRSGRAAPNGPIIDQLGRDLARVLDACAATGPVILVGHSMGGMTVMALAAERPELFGGRIRGVALIATSAGGLDDLDLHLPRPLARLFHKEAPRVAAALAARSELIDRNRARTTDLDFLLTKRLSFGGGVSRDQARFVADLIGSTPIEVVADFLPEFDHHDKMRALSALDRVETLVMVGDRDVLTPESHSRQIVREVPGAELVILPATGHMIITERHQEVSEHLVDLLATVRARG